MSLTNPLMLLTSWLSFVLNMVAWTWVYVSVVKVSLHLSAQISTLTVTSNRHDEIVAVRRWLLGPAIVQKHCVFHTLDVIGL